MRKNTFLSSDSSCPCDLSGMIGIGCCDQRPEDPPPGPMTWKVYLIQLFLYVGIGLSIFLSARTGLYVYIMSWAIFSIITLVCFFRWCDNDPPNRFMWVALLWYLVLLLHYRDLITTLVKWIVPALAAILTLWMTIDFIKEKRKAAA